MEASVSQDFDTTTSGQAEDPVPQQVTLRPPPVEEPPKRLAEATGRTDEHQDAAVLVGEPILAQEVLIVGHKEETPRTPVDLGIGGVSTEATLSFPLSDLTETGQRAELIGDPDLDVMVEQDEGWLFGLSVLAAWHRLAVASAWRRGAGTGRCRSYPCP